MWKRQNGKVNKDALLVFSFGLLVLGMMAMRPSSQACQVHNPPAAPRAAAARGDAAAATKPQASDRTRTYLSWSLRYGLSNQLYSQVNGLALALLLGVDGAILPPAVTRRTFNVTLDHLRDEDLWSTRPLGTLLDVERMREHWRAHHGIELQEAAKTVMTSEGAPYPRPLLASARPAGEPADCAVLQLNVSEFSTLAGAAASARALLEGARQERGPGGCIILRTESLFRGFWYNSTAGLQTVAARGLFFAANLEALAEKVADQVDGKFNALHLRFEKDMSLKPEELLPIFIEHMKALGFSRKTRLYTASGLLSYGDSKSLQQYTSALTSAGVCGRIVVKEDLLSEEDTRGLHSEQLALLDLLVLKRANKFVGTKRSAFSYLARELRLLAGHAPATSRLHPPQWGGFWQDGVMELAGLLG